MESTTPLDIFLFLDVPCVILLIRLIDPPKGTNKELPRPVNTLGIIVNLFGLQKDEGVRWDVWRVGRSKTVSIQFSIFISY